ncbi:MAG: DMT family transporter [Anaerolineales bacterium]
MPSLSPRARATAQALLVTFLWATSWVLIKFGLQSPDGASLPPLTFAGLRYGLAWLCLLPLALRPGARAALRALPAAGWGRLAALGVLFYALTQGGQFVALKYLPAITLNLLLNFSSILVAVLGVALLAERPTRLQWLGMALALVGALVFFYPLQPAAPGQAIGYAAAGVALLANAAAAVLGRRVNQAGALSPLLVTTISMGIGAALLLVTALALQGLPRLAAWQWAIVAWLAVVNTAFAFTLWNHTLRTLTALESSILNGLLIVQIPILAWLFLGETLTPIKVGALAGVGLGALAVQLRRLPARPGK